MKSLLLALMCVVPLAAEQPLRIFIRANVKTHGRGQHDYPKFLTEWKTLLTNRGAVVDGAQRFPTSEELAKTDVLIIFATDGGTIATGDRDVLMPFVKAGGGLVVLHDGMCANDPTWFAGIIGGAKQHGERNFRAGALKLHFEDRAHPIVQGMADLEMNDEMFFLLRVAPEMHVLATSADPSGKDVPQLWTLEKTLAGGKPYRAFVSMQGHQHATFDLPQYQTLLLRGIAWAGRRSPELLTK